jgi:hypothetical protein
MPTKPRYNVRVLARDAVEKATHPAAVVAG